MYWTENQLLFSIPVLEKSSKSPRLQEVLADHLEMTKEPVGRLEMIFETLQEQLGAVKCNALEGLDMDAENILQNTPPKSAKRDIGIIHAAQKVEQHEVASYLGLIQLSTSLNRSEVVATLTQTLEEEKLANRQLQEIFRNEFATQD